MFTIEDIYSAYRDCIKHKKSTSDYLEYINTKGEEDLYDLLHEINSKNYQILFSTCFIATKPKLREIFAANFRDRIVHHLIVKNIEPYFEKRFSSSVYSCRIGKGNIRGVKDLFNVIKGLSNKEDYYYLQMDIKSFFMSIDKDILFELLHKNLTKFDTKNFDLIMYLLKLVIYNDSTKNCIIKGDRTLFSKIPNNKTLFKINPSKGLPIGNLTSQFFANVYLNEADQYIKRTLKIRYYFRYVDDFILIGKNDELVDFKGKIEKFLLNNLKLELSHSKTKFLPINYDIDFIGYVIKDKSYILPRKRNINSLKEVVYKKDLISENSSSKLSSSVNSYLGLLKHSKAYNLSKKFSFKLKDNCVIHEADDYSKIILDKTIYNILDNKDKTMQKYKEIIKQFKKHIVFMQIGCFYKAFYNEAIFIAPKLGLKLSLFNPRTRAEAIMCGFHDKYLDKYIVKLENQRINYVILTQKIDGNNIERFVSHLKLFDEHFTVPIAASLEVQKIKKQYFENKIDKSFLIKSHKNDLKEKEIEFLEEFKNKDILKMNNYEILTFIYSWKTILGKQKINIDG